MRPVFLVGFMGAGKTSVGQELARMQGWRFADTDVEVERTEGRSIEAIFEASGEGSFRAAEWRVLQALISSEDTVIATGGGLFLGVAQRRCIVRTGVSVWLDVPLEVARRRIASGGDALGGPRRPLWRAWAHDDPLALRAFFERRRAAYALANLRLDAGRGSPRQLAGEIVASPLISRGEW